MAENIYINTDQPIDRAVVAGANQPTRRFALAEFVEGATQTANLYFVKNDGTFDARSGDAAVAVRASVGRDNAVPASGTFTLKDAGNAETAAIAYGASAQAVEDAINALNGGAGLGLKTSYSRTDGIDDSLINADCSAAGEGDYYMTGIVRSDSGGVVFASPDGDFFSVATIPYNPGVWQSFTTSTITTTPDIVTAGSIGFLFGDADWREIKLYRQVGDSQDQSVDTLIGYWDLGDRSSGSLDGVTALDSSGNGYNGINIGGTAFNEYIDGASFSLVDVTKQSDTLYTVINRTVGEATALTGTSIDLTPESSVTPSLAIAGSATQRSQQIIEIKRQPAIYTSAWSAITNGFTGTLSANNARVAQSLQSQSDQPFIFEVSLDGDVVCQVQCEVEPAITPPSAFPADSLPTALSEFAGDPSSNASFDADAWNSALDTTLYGQLYFSATAATTIAVAGTYVKLAGTTTSDSLNGITMPQNNRLQNNSGTTRVFQAMARTDIIDGSGNKNIAIKLAKNGVLIDATESNGETTNNVAAHATINWIVSLAAGEYVEIWATNKSDTSSITAQHGHLFLKAID